MCVGLDLGSHLSSSVAKGEKSGAHVYDLFGIVVRTSYVHCDDAALCFRINLTVENRITTGPALVWVEVTTRRTRATRKCSNGSNLTIILCG